MLIEALEVLYESGLVVLVATSDEVISKNQSKVVITRE